MMKKPIQFNTEWERCACGLKLEVGGKDDFKYLYCPKCEPQLKGDKE